jgi:4-aminobutyrate aminotransferase-like enzyme
MRTADLLVRRNRWFGAGARLFYRQPLEIIRGEGCLLYDVDGRAYVDMYNNVPCIGHGERRLADAIARQQSLLNVHSRYLSEDILRLAERFCTLYAGRIESVIFSCSGTEANEIALRMARMATGARGVIATNGAYHGNNELVGGLCARPAGVASADGVGAFAFPDPFRSRRSVDDETERCLHTLDLVIDGFRRSGQGVAALIVCPLMANEGLPGIPPGFLSLLARRVRAAGGLIICDEVQSGYGRTGQWRGYENSGLDPDIIVCGKPMGGGVPLSATAASRDLIELFRARTRYFNTFASSPLQAAAGNAVIDVITEDRLVENAARTGAFLRTALEGLIARADWLGELRGEGLFLGIDIVKDPTSRDPDPERASDVVERLREAGFLTGAAGAFNNVVKIRPPLVFSEANARAFAHAFSDMVDDIDDRR